MPSKNNRPSGLLIQSHTEWQQSADGRSLRLVSDKPTLTRYGLLNQQAARQTCGSDERVQLRTEVQLIAFEQPPADAHDVELLAEYISAYSIAHASINWLKSSVSTSAILV